jgi:hypothetical protein
VNRLQTGLSVVLLIGLAFLAFAFKAEGNQAANSHLIAEGSDAPEDSKDLLKVVDAFFTAVRKANYSQAYYGYASQEFREVTKFPQFKQFIDRFPSLARLQTYKVAEVEHYDTLATITAVATSADRKENIVVLDAIWEAGKWRILGIQIYLKPPHIPD